MCNINLYKIPVGFPFQVIPVYGIWPWWSRSTLHICLSPPLCGHNNASVKLSESLLANSKYTLPNDQLTFSMSYVLTEIVILLNPFPPNTSRSSDGRIIFHRTESGQRVFCPQTCHPTLAPMTELGHQNLPLLNQKLQLLQTYTRCHSMMSYISSELFNCFRSSPQTNEEWFQ